MTTDQPTIAVSTPREARALWAAGLRSDRYEQGTGALCQRGIDDSDDALCVMGVACDVWLEHCGLAAGARWAVHDGSIRTLRVPAASGCAYFEHHAYYPPQVVMDWLGLARPEARFEPDGVPDAGAELPDLITESDCGATFSELADIIESGRLEVTS